MHFGIATRAMSIMQTQVLIERLVETEMTALCVSCLTRHDCALQRITSKIIIHCESYNPDFDENVPKGLCKTCDNASVCQLPGRKEGIWHCNEFR
jgi:hypothetical protein